MRRFNSGFVWLIVLLPIWASLAVPQALAASPTQGDDGVAEFLRTHPGYRGYVTPHPPYPAVSRMLHEQGTVVVRVTFAKEGQVSAVEVVKSSGYQNLDGNAVNYIKARWRSASGRVKTLTLPLTYRLR